MRNKLLICLLLLSTIFFRSNAQIDIPIGTGTAGNDNTTYPAPLQDYYEGSRAQYLYRASELTSAGMTVGTISAIKFNVQALGTSTNSFFALEQYTIKIGTTTTNSLTATTWEPGTTTVYGPVDYNVSLGINTFTFTTPFLWNGTDNLVVEICNGDPLNTTYVSYTGNSVVPWTTDLTFNGSHNYRADELGNLCGSATTTNTGLQTTRPNIIFRWVSAVACSGTPLPGTAVSSITNILCPGTQITLSVTGGTSASGLTYQWQSSLDNITWTNITGATSPSYTTTQTEILKYYRRTTTCGTSAPATSSAVQVNSVTGPVYRALPLNESFEATWINGCDTRDIPNSSWKNTPVTGNNSWRRYDDGTSAAWGSANGAYTPSGSDGVNSARFHSYDGASGSTGTLDVYINGNTTAARKRLMFDYINTSGNDSLTVLLSTDGGINFVRLDSSGLASEWRTKTIIFNTTSATSVLRFRGTADFGVTDIGIDNIRLTEFGDCAGTPLGGTAASSNANVCLATPFTLTVTGATDAAGLTYQWQSSTDNINWTNVTGQTAAIYTATQAASTYYRRITTCTNGNASTPSTSIQVTSPAAVFGTYTINKGAPASASNFQSFNAAYDYIKCGISAPVVFNVVTGSGPYTEQLIMTPVPGASGVNTVTFNGNGQTINFLSTNTNERAVIKLNGADNIRFDSLVITALGSTTTEYGFGVQLLNNADSNIINRCTINVNTASTSTNYAGLVVSFLATSATGTGDTQCDYNTFSNNTINGGYYGLTMVSSTTTSNSNNKIINNIVKEFYFYGMYIYGTFQTLIERNTITRPTRATVSSFYGIYVTNLSARLNISKNKITNPFGGASTSTSGFYGIYFTACDALVGLENVVSNNLIYGLNANGDHYGFYNSSSDNVLYYHNTISMDGPAGASSAFFTRGFYQITTAAGIDFRNNIITITRDGLSAKHAIYFSTNTTVFTANRNDYYIGSTTGTNYIGYWNTNQPTLNNWQTATGQDAQSLSINPLYTSIATGNYAPTSSLVDNRGLPVGGITDDILNVTRSTSTPDIGAYEFTPAACTVPPTPGTATATPNPVCVNAPISVGLTGQSIGSAQTYQWQTSTLAAGPWTNLGNVLNNPDSVIIATTTRYYRVALTCGGSTTFSVPVLVNVNPALPGGTYSINSATATVPLVTYNSFNAAKAAMACGIAGPVVFNVVTPSTVTYAEQLVLDSIPGTSAINTVTFNGNGNKIAFSSSNTDQRAVIKLNGTDHIRFDSLTIDANGTGTYGVGVQLVNNADSNVFRRCNILTSTTSTSTFFEAVVINATDQGTTTTGATLCDSNTFDKNVITGGYYGITLVGSTVAPFIFNNKFTNNTIQEFYFYGLYTSGTVGTLIEANTFTRPTRANASTHYGIYLTGISTNNTISKNRFTNPFGGAPTTTNTFYGIFHSGADAVSGAENKVTNNIFYNINGEGAIYALYNSSSDYVLYYHNTISLDNTTSASTSVTRAFYQITDALGMQFRNNLITITRGGTGIKHAIYLGSTPTTLISNYNDLYVNSAGGGNFVGYNGADRATLAAWQAATMQDANSIAIDPFYTSVATGNLLPRSVALDNRGTSVLPLVIGTDIVNVPRNATTPDIGAFEFTIPPCTTPPTAGASVAVPNSGICLGSVINLSLNGHSSGAGQTYQWQYSPTLAGPYLNLAPASIFSDTTIFATTTLYYRAAITCSGNTAFSTPVLVTINPAFLSGFYTINPAAPVSTTNFQNFATAVAALECGITGFVTFDVSPGTYNEQIRMHRIAGATATSRVTFRSLSGVPSSVILTTAASTATANYVLQLDSASFITYRSISITATNTINGRAVELANTASSDSIVNCLITTPASISTANTITGVYANGLKGGNNVIKGNTITNGSNGIYFAGTSATNLTAANNQIDSNTVNGAGYYGIYVSFTNRVRVNKNTINTTIPVNTTAYSLYANYCDSAYSFTSNNVNITNTTGTVYGMYFNFCDASLLDRGTIAGNKVVAVTGITGALYGMYQNYGMYNSTVNNVITIKTASTTAYGIYSTLGSNNNYYNNTSLNTSTAVGTANTAAYFNHTSFANGNVDIRNNVFSNKGGSRALYFTNSNFIYSDYNTLYTTGTVLVQSTTPAGSYATLDAWKTATTWDVNSMVYPPAFVSDADPRPDIASSDVWAMHGRGVQILGNNYDFFNNPRPTTLTAGVPDMGAYEFLPTSVPPVLIPTPATPAAGITQTFMFGTDTVAKVTWPAASTVPTSINLKRYSGVLPPALPAASKSMYFYTDIDYGGTGTFNATLKQYYIDPWQGFIPTEPVIKMGKTNAANAWVVNAASTVNDIDNVITETGLTYLDKFTGLTDGTLPPTAPLIVSSSDSSNAGTKFWVGYGHHQLFGTDNSQDMVIYLSALQPANVTVRVNGTPWSKTYAVPGNGVVTSAIIPKSGVYDARLTVEGLSTKGILITSDAPIVAYAHIYGTTSSGATLLLPVGTYGYDYTALTSMQNYATNTYSWFNVIAEYDSTVVQITPSNPTLAGRPAGVPFNVTLMRGNVYQVLGALLSPTSSDGYDLTGSRIISVANAAGKCYPMAVFSGSSRTNINCAAFNVTGSGDNIIQQNFPSQAWGRRYLTAPTSASSAANSLMTNIYRIAVKDPTAPVSVNGIALPFTSLINNFYYQIESNTADLITSTQPVMVAQYMSSGGGCTNTTGNGDPEMIYISPIEQGIKKVGMYRNTLNAIINQYLTLIIPTTGLSSLLIDGSSTFDYTYPHSVAGYTVVVKRWTPAGNAQVLVQSDSAFTAITYGLGSAESYGYNAGTLVKNLNALPAIANTLNPTGATTDITCRKTPFKVSILIALRPTELTWKFSNVPAMTPHLDVTQLNPTPADSVVINGIKFYKYTVPQDYVIMDTGVFYVPIVYKHPSIEGCSNSLETQLKITVVPGPTSDFTFNSNICVGSTVQFNGTGSNGGFTINRWNWDFSDTTTSTIQNPTKVFAYPGIKLVKLQIVATNGCIGDTIKPVTVNPLPVVNLVADSLSICPGVSDTLRIANPITGVTYNWYNVATGGTPIFTGTKFPVTVTGVYYVEATQSSCTSVRKKATVIIYTQLATPVVTVDSAGVNFIRWKWNAVPGAVSYLVSTDGTTFVIPSSGATGLNHTISGLRPLQTMSLIVRAVGAVSCQNSQSLPVSGRTLPDEIYIPNAFTPNGDGRNDVLLAYGYVIKDMSMAIFNQWGQKIFESNNQSNGWNGTYKGKPQPVGVYMYVATFTLNDGTTVQRKGSVNLVR